MFGKKPLAFALAALLVGAIVATHHGPAPTSTARLRLAEITPAPAAPSTELLSPATALPPTAHIPPRARGLDPIPAFAAWASNAVAIGFSQLAPADLTRGIELATTRRDALKELIRSNPEQALASALPFSLRRRLPAPVQARVEETIHGRGSYGVLIATDIAGSTADVRREVVISGRRFDAFVYGKRLRQSSRARIPIHGIAIDDQLAVAETSIRLLEAGEPVPAGAAQQLCPVSGRPAEINATPIFADVGDRVESFCGVRHASLYDDQLAAENGGDPISAASTGGGDPLGLQDTWSQGPKTCLFMRVAFPDDPTEPITEDGAYALMDGVNQWYVENSYDTTSIVPTVTPLLMLSQTKAWYSVQGTGRLLADAREAARTAGFNTDNYRWDIVRHSNVPGFNYGGLGYVRGKGVWLQSSTVGVACHELGHNYGLWHANSWGGINDSVIGPGTHTEYGNSFDTMGSANAGNYQFNAAFKHQLEWMPEPFVQTVTENGTYRLYTYDVPTLALGQIYALKIHKTYDRNYWAEFRQKFALRWFQSGVLLNWDPWNNGVTNSAGGTHFLDTTPGTPDGKNDGPVVIGRTFSDRAAGIHLTPIAKGSGSPENWIDVVVNLGPFTNNAPPLARVVADRTAAPTNGIINFYAEATDPEGDALAYAWDFGDATFGPNSPAANKSWATNGEYVVRCTVSDMKGGVFSSSLLVTIGSTTNVHVTGRIVSTDGQPLEGVRVYNGQTAGAYRGTHTDSDGRYILANLPPGTASLAAVKYGYTLTRAGWTNPVSLGAVGASLDWTGAPDPIVTLVATTPVTSEGSTQPAVLTLSRTGPTLTNLIVKLNRSGSASTADYTNDIPIAGTPLQIVLPAGVASLDIHIFPINDTLSEGPETLTLTLQEDPAYVLDLAEATVTILDNEPAARPVVSVSASSPGDVANALASENGTDPGIFVFSRTGSTATELTLYYRVSGTATPDADYVALPGVVTVPIAATSTALPLTILDDLLVESNETVVVTLITNSAYTISGNTAFITILDDDPPTVTVTATDEIAREAGANPGVFTITRQGDLSANLQVFYLLGGTASPADYAATPGSVTIPAGHTAATVTVTPVSDGLVEGEETVQLTLAGAPSYNVGNPGLAVVRLIDAGLPSITLAASTPTALEQGRSPGSFTFTRTGPLSNDLVVYFSTLGTAIPGADFDPIGNQILIPAGSSNALLSITPVDDALVERDESVALRLAPDPSYSIGTTAPQIVTIKDNDAGLPAVGFTVPASSGPESATSPRLSVSLSTNSSVAVTVAYAVTGGSATGGGVDYTLNAGTLTFAPGTINQSIAVTVVDDALAEPPETIVVTLSQPTNAVLDVLTSHTYTILDNDANGVVSVAAIDPVAAESGLDPGVFRITRSTVTTNALAVLYQLLGSASAPTDFLPLPPVLLIPAGSNSVDVAVVPVDDSTAEGNETVILNLLPGPGYHLGTATATVTILDNDSAAALPVVRLETTTPTTLESGTVPGRIEIVRDGPTNAALTVLFTVGGSATAGSDYVALSNSAVIPAGATRVPLLITPRNDALYEGDETVIVTLTVAPAYRVGFPASGRVLILDDENTVSIQADATPDASGTSLARFVVSRSGSTASNVIVHLVFAGTATGGIDYQTLSNAVLIPAGTNAVAMPVQILGGRASAGTETVVARLATGSGYSAGVSNTATLLLVEAPWDLWRRQAFTEAELADALVSGAQADPDGDQLRNLLEYAFNTDPKHADAPAGLQIRPLAGTPPGATASYGVSFPRRLSPTDVRYELEISADLMTWISGSNAVAEIRPATPTGDGVTERATFRVLGGTSSGVPQFIRLKVSLAASPPKAL